MRLTKFLITGFTRPFFELAGWHLWLNSWLCIREEDILAVLESSLPPDENSITQHGKHKGSFGVRCQTRYCLSSTTTPFHDSFFCRFCPAEGMGLPIIWLLGSQRPNVREVSFWGEGTRRMEAEQQCHSTLRLAGMSIDWHWAGRLHFARESTE